MALQNWSESFGSTPAIPFSSLPPAAGNGGLVVPVSLNGRTVWLESDGAFWLPQNGQALLAQCGIPVGIAPSGSVAANGAITLGTALGRIYAFGIWLYFPAGALYAGSVAGHRWCVMSSTTLGTAYDNLLSSATETPYIPPSPTPIVAAGPGAFTGSTSTNLLSAGVLVPGNAMGVHGLIRFGIKFVCAATAGTKYMRLYVDGADSGYNLSIGASSAYYSGMFSLQNVGVANKQIMPRLFADEWSGGAGAGNIMIEKSYDTTVDHTYQLSVGMPAATDYAIIEAFELGLQA